MTIETIGAMLAATPGPVGAVGSTPGLRPAVNWRWGVVTAVTPLRVRLEGETGDKDMSRNDVSGQAHAVGDRVWCQLFGHAVLVVGSSKPPAVVYPLVVNAAAYGPVADGTADAQPALQAAANAAAGWTLLIPPGTYRLDSLLLIPEGTRVTGYGATLKRGTAPSTILSNLTGDGSGTSGPAVDGYGAPGHITVEGLTLDGTDTATSPGRELCAFVAAEHIILRDMTFLRVRGEHMSEINRCRHVRIENCSYRGYFSGGTDPAWAYKEAIQIDIGTDAAQTMCDDVVITGCYAGPDQGNDAPFVLAGSHSAVADKYHTGINVVNCRSDGCSFALVDASQWQYGTIANNVILDAGTYGVRLVNQTRQLTVSGNIIGCATSATEALSVWPGGTGPAVRNTIVGNDCWGGGTLRTDTAHSTNTFSLNRMDDYHDSGTVGYIAATSGLSVTATLTQVPGMTIGIYVPGQSAEIKADLTLDISPASNLIVGELLVDGAAQPQQIITALSGRATLSQHHRISGLSAGVHTFSASAMVGSGAAGGAVNSQHSTLRVEVLGS